MARRELARRTDQHPQRPPGLCETLQSEWHDLWISPLADVIHEVDVPVLRRLFLYRQEHRDLMRAWRDMEPDERIIENRGTTRMHPYEARIRNLETQMLAIEDRFGLSPASRARLELDISNSQLTWEQVRNQQSKGTRKSKAGAVESLPVTIVEE